MEGSAGGPRGRLPVLCHGDVSPVHVFVDPEMQVVGLIDWGMWHGGPAVSELAGLAMKDTRSTSPPSTATELTDPALRRLIAWRTITRAIRQSGGSSPAANSRNYVRTRPTGALTALAE